MITIDRCVCANRPFVELKQLALAESLDLTALAEKTQCCKGCGLCRPYVEAMLKTGQTVFHEIIPAARP